MFTCLGRFRNPCSLLLNSNGNLITERRHNGGGAEAVKIDFNSTVITPTHESSGKTTTLYYCVNNGVRLHAVFVALNSV